MKHSLSLTGLVALVAVAILGGGCRQQEPATLTLDEDIRALVESSRRAHPPELRAAAVIDLHAAEEETYSPDKHTYTVDPSIEYADLVIRLRPDEQLKGRILSTPAQQR